MMQILKKMGIEIEFLNKSNYMVSVYGSIPHKSMIYTDNGRIESEVLRTNNSELVPN